MKTFIEIQEFGDFDTLQSRGVMFHEEKIDRKDLVEEFCKEQKIKSNTGLEYSECRLMTDRFIIFLKSKGFKRLEMESIYFSV